MSLVIGKERAVSHSCLVASCIDMPEELEEDIENLDDIFQRQMNTVIAAAKFINEEALTHPVLANWPHVTALTKACNDRARYIMMNDYIRAMSYGAMRMVNSRLTDVLNAIMPIKRFLREALEKIKKEERALAEGAAAPLGEKSAVGDGEKNVAGGEKNEAGCDGDGDVTTVQERPIPKITITYYTV